MQKVLEINKSKNNIYIKSNNFLFSLLVLICILDPSNTIFKSKEILFSIFCLHGIINFINNFKLVFFISSIFFALLLPLFYIIVGKNSTYFFSFSVAIDNLKVFLFLFLINFLLNTNFNYSTLFSKTTLVLIPVSIIIFVSLLLNKFEIVESLIGEYTKTLMIANRDFGNFNFIMIYYKTVSLLIFGLAFQLSLPYSLIRNILIFLTISILVLSATRANIFSVLLLLILNMYFKYFSLTIQRKITFFVFLPLTVLFLSNFFISTFFDKNEDSINIKFSFISDYIQIFIHNPSIFFFGQGLGSGIITKERGLTYNLETTYFELIRIFGIPGFLLILGILLLPLIIYIVKKNKHFMLSSDRYFMLAYLCYVFLIIPSNPLLLSSTGMIVLVVTYSLINRVISIPNK